MLARRSLGACSVLGVFYDAPAQVLESEHMLGLLVLGLDAQRVLGEHQGITEYSRLGPKLRAHAHAHSCLGFQCLYSLGARPIPIIKPIQ